MAMSGQYNLFNLMGDQPEEKLKHILAKVDIDYQQHFPPGGNAVSKEAALANVLNAIQTSRKIITFKNLVQSNFAIDQEVIKEQNIEKNIEQIKIISTITRKILNKIVEEAIQQFITEEQIKDIRILMGEWRQKYENEKNIQLREIYSAEIQRILADEFLQKRLQQLNQEYAARANQHDIKINDINNLILDIKEKKSSTVNEAAIRVSDELANHKAENSDIYVYRDVVPAENRDQFMKDFLKEYYKVEKEELKKYIALDKHDQSKVQVQLPSLINYQLARNNNKSMKELAKKDPDFRKIFIETVKKNGGDPSLLTSAQIDAEAKLLAERFQQPVLQLINNKKEKIGLREECVKIEAEKQQEKVKMQSLYAKLELPPTAKVTKTPAAQEFDDFLDTVTITPKQPKATSR